MMNKTIAGIIPPAITPILDNDTLDIDGLKRLLNRMIQGGVNGVFILGTTGEAQNLSYDVRKKLIGETCRIVNKRVSVLVGITDTSFAESIRLAQRAAENGADAVVAAPPYYFTPGQAELIQYYNDLANQLPLPLFLYNMPSHVKVMIEPATVVELAKNPNIVGLKDSSANGVYFQKLLYLMKSRPDFSLLVGPEEMMAEIILMGGHGSVSGGANLFPELYVALYNAAVCKNFSEIERLQSEVMQVSLSLYTIGKYGSSYIKGIKCALHLMGICSDYMAEPFNSFQEKERDIVREQLIRLGIEL